MTIVRAVIGDVPGIAVATREGFIAVTPTGTAGPAGPANEWRFDSGYLQTRPVDLSSGWANVIAVSAITGPMPDHSWSGTQLRFETEPGVWGSYVDLKGDAVEIGVDSGFIRWRPTGGSWTNIVELTDLVGPDGPAIELQKTATHIQWRVVGDPAWINLVALTDIKGDQGIQGPIGINLPSGPWNSATAYVARDVVTLGGSSWICLADHTNQSPPTLPTTANAYWSLLAKIGDTPTSLDISGVAGLTSELLGSAHSAITVAATDIVAEFIYDTTLDDDKGAWRHRCAHTSWWNEALNIATRGSKREFPAKAKLVLRGAANAGSLTIYDLTDLDSSGAARMWMVFTVGSNNSLMGRAAGTPSSVCSLNGRIYVTQSGTEGSLSVIDFPGDKTTTFVNTAFSYFSREIARRNVSLSTAPTPAIPAGLVDRNINHVHALVYPGAPTDALGLPIPKVAVATAGGVSVIHEDGAVYDITRSSPGNSRAHFLSDGRIAAALASSAQVDILPVPYADATVAAIRQAFYSTVGANLPTLSGTTGALAAAADAVAVGNAQGLSLFLPNPGAESAGMVSYAAINYATGWQVGDIRGAYLCDTTTGNITGGTVSDRSYKAGALSVVGTLSRTAVNTGSDLAAFSGFSSSNYLEQSYSANLDFGAGDFSFSFWIKATAAAVDYLFCRDTTAMNGKRIAIYTDSSGNLRLQALSTANVIVTTTGSIAGGAWRHVVGLRRSGVLELWLDGALIGTAAQAETLSGTTEVMRIGVAPNGSEPATDSSISLFRVSATAPSAAQIARMYRDELPLFNAGTKACLGGASNAVASMDFDTWSQRLLVGTGDGVSEYSGLVRVGYFDTANTPLTNDAMKAVAAQGGYRSMAGGQQSIVVREKVSQHDVVNAYPEQLPAAVVNELAAIRSLALLGMF